MDEVLQERQAVQDAVLLLLDTFCRAHAEDHMSDHTKLGSWRLPYVAMLHSYSFLHLPLIRHLEMLLHSSGASLGPVQCSALSAFVLFMNPFHILPKDVTVDVDQVDSNSKDFKHSTSPSSKDSMDGIEIANNSPNRELKSTMKEKQVGKCRVKALFEWRWEACFKAETSALKSAYKVGHDCQVRSEGSESGRNAAECMKNLSAESTVAGDHWMNQFYSAFATDNEKNILWATRFAASYLRNVVVYWEHIMFDKGTNETWLLTDLALQLKNITLVGPIFVAFVPQNMVIFLIWLQQRLDFANVFEQSSESAWLKKALALCETVLASPLGVLLRSTKVPLSLSKFFEMELRIGWKEWVLSKSRLLFLRYVTWRCTTSGAYEYFRWGLLWKDYGGDRARACLALTAVFLTSQCPNNVESRLIEGHLLRVGSFRKSADDMQKSSWSGTKKQCVRADTPDTQDVPYCMWLKESEPNPAEVHVLQIILELASKLDPQHGPWLLEVAFDCLNNQARMEDAILMHCDACTYAHKCKSKHYNPGVCSAYRLKSCIAALPPSHYLSHESLHKMEKVFKFCWLGDGPFSSDFAGQVLSSFHNSSTTTMFLKAENEWNTLLLAAWVRFFDVVGPHILNLHHMIGDFELGSILKHLHATQQFLTSNSKSVSVDTDGFKAAAIAMPQLAAVTMIEALLTASSSTSFILKEGYLAKLATVASQRQHEVSVRTLDILRKVTGGPREQEACSHKDQTTVSDDSTSLFLKSLLFKLVDLLSVAAIPNSDLIIKKWTALEYKRKWVSDYTPLQKEPRGGRNSTNVSLESLELEFEERIDNPLRTIWDILLGWVVTLIRLSPDSTSSLLTSAKVSNVSPLGETSVQGPGIQATGLKALTLSIVVAGLPRDTVTSLLQSKSTKASWILLLAQMRLGLDEGFSQLFLGNVKPLNCNSSVIKAEMDFHLLRLQGIIQESV
ncbi:uncharacterized protein [Physcomitrium patens]|nr:uncharacterized protein LOC112292175 isoform X3 [Physcomitrium patens]XP_024396168.1 uncharacterized protein LOC112292175 isoform X3 [Physcomitrium patens]XP_024396169.1 uncharacterized protein LOC112292175 isoform X3 [Physcomitrium patens]|eukprot:XP_024396167.1 uncharacterized protein LOC112292175 isoform X3 [Physcomitrella patens]